MPIGHGVVGADHDEEDREGKVVIVQRAQRAGLALFWVRVFLSSHGIHHGSLTGNDDEEDIRRHAGPKHCTHVKIGRAVPHDLTQPVGSTYDAHGADAGQDARLIAQGALAVGRRRSNPEG